jgi:tetratricopeptide (TPR) repeat protein
LQVHAVDPDAYDNYLRGRYWACKANTMEARLCKSPAGCVSPEAWKALEYYQKAIGKDPSYAQGYAGVANGFIVLAASGGLPYKDATPKIKEAALKALALDPSLAEPHSSLAFIKLWTDWDWSGAEAELKQAIELNPNFADAHFGYSVYLVIVERLDEAVHQSERARDLDPFDFNDNEWLGQALYHARRYDDALRQIQRTLEVFPDRGAHLYRQIADVYEQKKMFAEAFAARQQVLSLNKDPNITALGEAYKRGGYRGYMLKQIQILEQAPDKSDTCLFRQHLAGMVGDEARAMTCLERTYGEHNGAILFIRTAPEFDSIRSSPRFRDLVRRIGFPRPANNN